MQSQLIRQLIELNQEFYRQVSASFHYTRQQPWDGWLQLDRYFSPGQSILDVAGGNGRLALFLLHQLHLSNLGYFNVDSNQFLLDQAHASLSTESCRFHLIKQNILDSLLNESNPFVSLNRHFDVVACFGFLHHVPSFKIRQQLLQFIDEVVATQGYIMLSCWQFTADTRLMKRAVTSEHVNINPKELEPNDYFLDWRQGESAIRYCHLVTPAELQQLTQGLDWKLVGQFTADRTNDYYVYQKISSVVK